MLFNNNGCLDHAGYCGRRLYWVTGGVAVNGFVQWSQPELVLYDHVSRGNVSVHDVYHAIVEGAGYPDWVELRTCSLLRVCLPHMLAFMTLSRTLTPIRSYVVRSLRE